MDQFNKKELIAKALMNTRLTGKFLCVLKLLYESSGPGRSYADLRVVCGYHENSGNLGISQVIGQCGLWASHVGTRQSSIMEMFLDVAGSSLADKSFQLTGDFRRVIDSCEKLKILLATSYPELLSEHSDLADIRLDISDFGESSSVLSTPTAISASGKAPRMSHDQRVAIELRAMNVVEGYLKEGGWSVEDTSKSNPEGSGAPFDFIARKGVEKKYVEVKGTTSTGGTVELTHGEVNHARANAERSVLAVVTGIQTVEVADGWQGEGGEITYYSDPWIPEDARLTAIRFKYDITA